MRSPDITRPFAIALEMDSTRQWKHAAGLVVWWFALSACGCSSDLGEESRETTAVDAEVSTDGLSANDILQAVAQTYRQADAYIDNARYHERYVRRDDGLEYDVPPHMVSVVFRRPGRLRLNRQVPEVDTAALNVTMTCNGSRVRAFVSDYTRQVLEYEAPNRLRVDNFLPDPRLREAVLPVPIENLYPQADLLLADEEQPARLLASGAATRLPSAELAGVPCYRVRLEHPTSGARVLWIDQQTSLLRRMEMPTRQVRDAMDLKLWIEFHDAALDVTIDDPTFEMEVPDNAVRVREFVPPPTGPPAILGKMMGEFAFDRLDGGQVTHDTLADGVTVLDFWFTDCVPCRQSTPALEALFEKYRETDGFAIYAVSIDRSGVSDDMLETTLKKWGGTMPILRDSGEVGREQMGVDHYPTSLLLGPGGKIHHFARGAKSSYEDWHQPIDQLLAGEDIAEAKLAEFREKQAEFAAALEAVSLDAGPRLGRPNDVEQSNVNEESE